MPKVTHICLANFYCEGYTYQENMLSRFHRKLGFDVDVIASRVSFDGDGKPSLLSHTEEYTNKYGVHVRRLDYAKPEKVFRILRRYVGLDKILEDSSPDIIFVHGCQFLDASVVTDYADRHPDVALYVDNHADYSNSATNWLSKHVLHRVVWRHCARVLEPHARMFWGVLPARVDFLVENYGLPREKCSLLVMGADDDEVARASRPEVRAAVRSRFGFSGSDFVVVTGGKIDLAKTQTLLLMDAVLSMGDDVKLLVFGPVVPELRGEFESRLREGKVVHVPWADSSEAYDYFSAADVVCFPGRHSVYWEQTAGMGKPLVVKRWPGTEHVDACGNVLFLESDRVEEIRCRLTEARSGLEDGALGEKARRATRGFMYSDISRRAIGLEAQDGA